MRVLDGVYCLTHNGALFRWDDEYGNKIAAFFSSKDAGEAFLKNTGHDATVEGYPLSAVVESLFRYMDAKTALFAIDSTDHERFEADTAKDFVLRLLALNYEAGVEDTEEKYADCDVEYVTEEELKFELDVKAAALREFESRGGEPKTIDKLKVEVQELESHMAMLAQATKGEHDAN